MNSSCMNHIAILMLSVVLFSCQDKTHPILIDNGPINGTQARAFQIIDEDGDVIDFIKVDAEMDQKKPVLIMLQGSLPIPLVIRSEDRTSLTSIPFQLLPSHLEPYHIVVISKPHVPVIVSSDDIAPNATYKAVSPEYNKANYLQNYVRRTKLVIDVLSDQSWVDSDSFVLLGHSEGSYVAIKVGSHPKVSRVGALSFEPRGRYQQYYTRIHADLANDKITEEQATQQIDQLKTRWEHIEAYSEDDSQEHGDTFKATYSFSESFIDDIAELPKSIFIGYGTADVGARGCDSLSIQLDQAGKSDYRIVPYEGLGHNFEEVDSTGRSNFDKMYWDKTFQDFLEWVGD